MTAPLISCIVPVFNGERYLGETLDSILVQTYRPIEILVVDDGSTDGTAAIVAAYGERVRSLFRPNAGPAAARNLGLSSVNGEFVAFLDADDLWHPEKLTRQMARFAARPDLDLCVTHIRNFWSPDVEDVPPQLRNHPRLVRPIPGYSLIALLARRRIFSSVGKFDTALPMGEDTDWFIRVLEHGATIDLLPDLLVHRRLHRTNFSWRGARPHSRERATFPEIVKASLDRRRRPGAATAPPLQMPLSSWRE